MSKEFSFEMAHALDGYDGLCRNIHGHSYQLTVTLSGEPISDIASPKYGMVMDFGDLKHVVQNAIINRFDHAFVVRIGTVGHFDNDKLFSRLLEVDFQPTSENLLVYIASLLIPALPEGVSLYSLRLRETGTSYAEWFAADNS
ncbi:MAG: 6-carboxytetrahydropterin synthase QueD [Bacteroidetes bacterium GWF2_43_63]|nr:MAG: 6-carboxytetrahydropterin synthase QueD [Bacteroidetes bacterium GWE2_42_42]OFY54956.1 MAG: 6-carboxytetrahydropterin synthase QueD [Bacteroidetes bacterium GWF2_43_63]HCB63165.1 6-carboxytetrahydropterin synthase QueD [Bacteroidales bacterium]HCY22230.1 6-carboxytetrahydropterin synthase QueD [Bacteroidales bacterium]